MTDTATCVACGDEPVRRLGLIGWTCRDCLERAFDSGDYWAWYNART